MLMRISQAAPVNLVLQVTNICNANCIFCGYQYLKRPKTILPMDLFRKAIDEFTSLGGGDVVFTPPVGEPLIDPDFLEKIYYARSKPNIRVCGFYTNGILINKVGARAIIRSGVEGITISIPGFDAQAYLRIFRTNQWDCVYSGIINLLRENALTGNKVNISLVLRSDISIRKLLKAPAYKELKKYKFFLEYNMFYDNWGGLIKQKDLIPRIRLRKIPKKTEPCFLLYGPPLILANGDMTLCGCRDLNGDTELVRGNIRNKSILEMWQDPGVDNVRKGFCLSRYPKICQACSFYNDLSGFRMEKMKNFLKRQNSR